MENENLTKAEFQYMKNIEKLEAINEKHDGRNADLQKKVEALQTENEQLRLTLQSTTTDLQDTTSECQKYCDDISKVNDELEKQIEELKADILPEEETEKEIKFIYHKQGMMGRLFRREDKSNWMHQEVLASDTERIQSLVDDGYEKKETELPIHFKK